MKKSLAIIVSIIFCSLLNVSSVLAQTASTSHPDFELAAPKTFQYNPSEAPNAQISAIRLNQPAPFAGTLWNIEASAWLIAEYENIQKYWITEMNRRVDLTLNWANSEIEIAHSRCDTDVSAMQQRLDAEHRNNQSLQQTTQHMIRQNRRHRIIGVSGGTVAVIVIVVGSVFLSKKIP